MPNIFDNFLKQVVTGDQIKDFKHASRLFVDNNFERSPKYTWLFHVYFDLNPELTNINQRNQIEYIFITNFSKISKPWPGKGITSEYFIFPIDIIEQTSKEISTILNKYDNIKEIKVHCNLYDESIKAYDQTSNYNLMFEEHIDHFFILNYTTKFGLKLTKTTKGKYKTFIESKKIGSSCGSIEYNQLIEEFGRLLDP